MFKKDILTRTPIYFITIITYLLFGSAINFFVSGIVSFIILGLIFIFVTGYLDYRIELKARDIYYGKRT